MSHPIEQLHPTEVFSALRAIFDILDGKEWDGGTLEDIGAILAFYGMHVRLPFESEEET